VGEIPRASGETTRTLPEEAPGFRRFHTGLLAAPEKRVLQWIARRLPGWVGPDTLTLLGLISLAVVGLAYYLAGHTGQRPLWLIVASAGLVFNWLGDGLDGAVARIRRRQRPNYGYYLDHLVDTFGAAFVLLGLAYSGLVMQPLCVAVMAIYLIMSINTYLATQTVGVFKVSFARLSPTEGRLALITLNTVLIFWVDVTMAGHRLRILDIVFGIAGAVLLFLTLRSAALNLTKLNRIERAKWEQAPASSRRESSQSFPQDDGAPRDRPPAG
jgi:phosphatidylglycerophosphate synthase